MIEAVDLSKSFGSRRILSGLSFQLKPGEILGFLGPNGAGKTTTMKILTGYWQTSGGSVKIAGIDMTKNPQAAKRHLGYLPEHNPLYQEMRVYEYLKFVAEIRDVAADKILERVKEMAAACGLSKVMGWPISQLSKGFRQRVGIAQAMMHNPDILILDEPTSGLDPNQIVEIRELIRDIGREKSVILSTHILPEVSAVCDRVLIINNGRIAAEGAPDELAARAGQATFCLSIKAPAAEALTALSDLPSVKAVTATEEDGLAILIIEPSNDSAQAEIAELIAARAWPVWEFKRREASLEEVFKSLTI